MHLLSIRNSEVKKLKIDYCTSPIGKRSRSKTDLAFNLSSMKNTNLISKLKMTLPSRAGLLLISCAVTLAVARQDSVVKSDNCINFSHIGLEPTEDCKFQ